MVEARKEQFPPYNKDTVNHLKLNEDAVTKGNVFLEQIGSITPIPDLPFSSTSSIFVFVPLYGEYENIKRLHESWSRQKLLEGVRAEVVFLINNPKDAPSGVKADNQATYDYLISEIARAGKTQGIGMHVIDRFSENNALPNGTTIADVRNIAVSPFVKHAIATDKNFIVLSTDADCFPSGNLVNSLYGLVSENANAYGVIERELEFPESTSPEERKQIEKLFLIHASEAILADYLSYGEWTSPVTTPGSGTFFTIEDFIAVGGYNSSLPTWEDIDLGNKLSKVVNGNVVVLEDCVLKNLQRYSDRVDGDGFLLQATKDKGYKIASHAELTVAHAKLRKWLVSSLATKDNIADSITNRILSFVKVAEILYEQGIEDLEEVFDTSGGSLEDVYDGIFENAVRKLYAKEYDIDESLKSYDNLVLSILGRDSDFIEIMRRLNTKGVDQANLVQTALQIFILSK